MTLPAPSSGDRFELRGQLGSGANGVVHRVYDRVRGRDVAMKTLIAAGGRELYRFKREFRALADLVHPNLVALHELYTTDGEWMFTMELVEGVSFHDWVRPPATTPEFLQDDDPTSASLGTAPLPVKLGPLDEARLRDALGQLADGLVALHGSGKLHRDIKPSNVLVEPGGRLVVLDFGLIADSNTTRVDRTHERGAVGTPAYMSPEQAADRPLTPASDWYAVGVMLFEVLTERRVFEGTSEVVLERKQRIDPPSPRQLVPSVPADLDALCTALLSRDPAARPDGHAVLAALGRTPSAETERMIEQSTRAPFVGRTEQLDELRRAFADARRRGVTAVIAGGSGMGKTALVRAFLDEISVDGEVVILEGRCYEREAVPFKALDGVIDGLTAMLVVRDPEEIAALIPGDAAALARLFPVLRRVAGMSFPTLPGIVADPLQLRRQALAALRTMLGRLAASRPVVISIDDLQWGDVDSATALAELIRGPDAPRMLVICTHRADSLEDGEILKPVRAAPDADLRQIDVGAISDADARALWRTLRGAGAASEADAAVRDAAGNPMLLSEMARLDVDGAPVHSVDEAVRARLGALGPDAQALLRAVAVGARPMGTELMVRAAGIADGRAPLTTLRLERLVRTRGAAEPTIEPSHDRIREAVVASMSDEERRRIHAAIAAALADAGAHDHELLVEHFLGAGDGATAGQYAETAAAAAEERLALHRAANLYGVALLHGDLEPRHRGELTARRAQTLAAAGRLLEAAVEYQAAASLIPVKRDRRALQRRGVEQLLRAGQLERGTTASAALLREVGVKMPIGWRRTILALLVERLRLKLRGKSYTPRPESEIHPDVLDRIDVLWSVATGFTFVNPVLVRVLATRMLRVALSSGDLRRITLAFALELGYLSTGGHRAKAESEELYVRAKRLADELGQEDVHGFVESCGGVAAYLGGRYRDARVRLDAGERLLRDNPTEVRWQLDTCEVFQVSNLWALGELTELQRLHARYLRAAVERGNVHLMNGLRGWRSNVTWLIRDDPAGAREAADLARPARKPGEPFHVHHYYDLLATGVIDLYEQHGDRALQRIEAAWRDIARAHLLRIEAIDVELHFLRGAAAVASRDADPGRGDDAEACAAHLEKVDSPLSRVLSAQLRGALCAVLGHRDRAIEHLRAAAAAAEVNGMAAHRAAAQLRLGKVLADAEGATLVANADRWFRDHGVVDVDRFVGILSPVPPRRGSPDTAPGADRA